MSLLRDDPYLGEVALPEIEVLIREARRRQRRRQARGAAVLLTLAGLGLAFGLGFFGPGGGGATVRGGGSGGGAGAASSADHGGSAALVSAAALPQTAYALSVEHRGLAVSMFSATPSNGCRTQYLSLRTLRRVGALDGCPAASTLPRSVVSRPGGIGDRVRLRLAGRAGGRSGLGPVLFTLDNWSWAHSGAVQGHGVTWIYRLKPMHAATLLEVSSRTGMVLARFRVPAGPDPFMRVDADGFWITPSAWGGSSCSGRCRLWHVAPGSTHMVTARRLGVRTQWLMSAGDSIYADVLTRHGRYGFAQSVWRLDGARAQVAYRRPATLLPSTDFASTGYVVVGNPVAGFFTLSQLGRGHTPAAGGSCDTAASLRVVRIDPATGTQRYVATLPRADVGSGFDCHLNPGQAALADGALYILTEQVDPGPSYTEVVKLAVRRTA